MSGVPGGLAAVVGRAALSNAALVPAQAVLSMVASAIIARVLGTSLFGTFAVFTALRASLLFYTDLGMSTAGSKFFPEVIEREGRAGAYRLIRLQAAITGAAAAVWILVLAGAASSTRDLLAIAPQHAFIIPAAAIALVIDECGRVAYVFLWGRFAHHRVNVANLLGAAALPVFVTAAALGDGGLSAIVTAAVAAGLVRTVLLWIATWMELRQIPCLPDPRPVPDLVGRFVRLGGVSWVDKWSGYLYGASFVTLVLATFLDKAAIGQFALAVEFTVRVLSLVLSPTHGLVLPAIATVFTDGTAAQRQRLFTAALRTLGLWLVPAGVLLIAAAPYVIPGLYSDQYRQAATLTQIVAVFYFAEYAIYSPANAVLLAGERLWIYTRIKLVSLALLPLFVVAVRVLPLHGIAALHGAMRLAFAVALLVAASRVQRLQLPTAFYARTMAAAALAALTGGAAGALLGPRGWAGVVASAAALGVTLLAYRRLGCLGQEERDTLERLNVPGAQWVLRFFHV